MKLSFSTLGSPVWSFGQLIDAAVQYGYQGVVTRRY